MLNYGSCTTVRQDEHEPSQLLNAHEYRYSYIVPLWVLLLASTPHVVYQSSHSRDVDTLIPSETTVAMDSMYSLY